MAADPKPTLRRAKRLRRSAADLLATLDRAERDAAKDYAAERDRRVRRQLDTMPVARLQTATDGNLRVGALEDAGFDTVGSVLGGNRRRLEAVQGVGPQTARQAIAAAERVEAAMADSIRVTIDVDNRSDTQTALLSSLRRLEAIREALAPIRSRLERLVDTVDAHIDAAKLDASPVRKLFAGARRKAEASRSAGVLQDLVDDADETSDPTSEPEGVFEQLSLEDEIDRIRAEVDAQLKSQRSWFARRKVDVWDEYLSRPVSFNGLLVDVAGLDGGEAARGMLPADIAERVETIKLDRRLLNVSLRGYQAFGAKFVLAQKKVILGDEMGLGKTIEALAVLSHLHAGGARHSLVVCPTSVLANWEHEIGRHTEIEPVHRLHGSRRDRRLQEWAEEGGIALTTFGTLGSLDMPDINLAAVVVDEAHYIKNPGAQRTKAVREWLGYARHVLMMSGTPMENRVDEFRNLVSYVRPRLAREIRTEDGLAGADAFRESVAPVYLRRNQDDVLQELPPKIETLEWVTLRGQSAEVYRQAVADGSFMAMRRAPFMTDDPRKSPKLDRLLEIVEEARVNDRKVVVFSYFLDVLDRVEEALGPLAAGSLSGAVAAARRQELVDEFSAREGPAVLVSQIEAGGVGLNIQAASVVILAEPQWKPSIEEQAIARCHRMGQVRPVEVHRLVAEDSVDEAMLVLLQQKSELFGEYARRSSMKDASAHAIDITDQQAIADAVTGAGSQQEQERQIVELERRRLGLESAVPEPQAR